MNTLQKPTLVNAIGWMTLASGIVNLFWGLAASVTAFFTIVGIICTPFTILPSILGIFEILYAAKLLSNPPQPVKPSTTIAVLEIACVLTGNMFAMVVGILALIFYNDQTVGDYFARLNGIAPLTPAPAMLPDPPVPAAPVVEPEPAPVIVEESTPVAEPEPAIEEESAPIEEPPATEAESQESPEKPKRTSKAAKK